MKISDNLVIKYLSIFKKYNFFNFKVFIFIAGIIGFETATWAGAYIFAGEANGINIVTHPTGYTGSGGTLPVNVCIVSGTPNEMEMEQSVRNIIEVYNQRLPTTGNLRFNVIPFSAFDFESVALHELGHCIGQAHVNAAGESGLPSPDINSTKATDGADNIFNINAGTDGVIGSSDDVRGDDVNLHWYRTANNHPFTIDYSIVDSTTYARDTANLPVGHLFTANADRTVGSNILSTPDTESVMQQGTFNGEIQRTVTPDGVATLQYAMSGLDEIQGNADDYDIQLNFATTDCDINIAFDDDETGLAVCSTGGIFLSTPNHLSITTANIFFNNTFNWSFNDSAPCSETLALTQNQWRMFTLPCSVGISTGNTVADILGDDLTGTYNIDWTVFERDTENNVYTRLALTDEMVTGKGYWVLTNELNQSVNVEGQFNGSPDTLLFGQASATGRQNLVGHPFDFSVDWEDVQIVDGAEIQTLAAAVVEGDLSGTYHIWNGNSYDAFDSSTPGMIGTLTTFDGIWVRSFKDGLRLRVPAIVSTGGAVSEVVADNAQLTASSTREIESTTKIASKTQAKERTNYEILDDGSWYIRLIVEAGDYKDSGNVLGQLPDSLDGQDHHDLEELAPIGSTHLSVIFPHNDWVSEGSKKPWGYTSDFHQTSRKPRGEWLVAVHGSKNIAQTSLRLEGPKKILRRIHLVDMETGQQVKFTKGVYTFDLTSSVRYFKLRVGKKVKR